jgi:hypothetical protein
VLKVIKGRTGSSNRFQGSNLMGGISNLMPGKKEEEVPAEPEVDATAEYGQEVVPEDQAAIL